MSEEKAAYDAQMAKLQRTKDSGLDLERIGWMIADEARYEQASALCLLSLAGSAERIAAALEAMKGQRDLPGMESTP